MRVIIAGSRAFRYEQTTQLIEKAVRSSGFHVTEVVSGCAPGIDKLGERWAGENGKRIKRFPADWDRFGKSAGVRRNEEMGQYADALIAIWDGESRGTRHIIAYMSNHQDKPVFIAYENP